MRRSLIQRGLALAFGLSLLTTPAALAAPPEQEHVHSSWTQTEELCGLEVTADRVRIDNYFDRPDGSGHGEFTQTFIGTTRWTYEPTGRWVENHFGGHFRLGRTQMNFDGTLSVFLEWDGPGLLLRTSDGGVVLREVGRIVVQETWDVHDPADPDDDEFLDMNVIAQNGQSLDDFDEVLCGFIVEFLTA